MAGNTLNRIDFMAYLRETLTPDLKAMGLTATAADFETALTFMETQFECAQRERPNAWKESSETPGLFHSLQGDSVREIRVHYCITSTGYYGRGLSIEEAVNACVKAGETRTKVQKFGRIYRLPVGVTHAAFNGNAGVSYFNRDAANHQVPCDHFKFDAKSKTWVQS